MYKLKANFRQKVEHEPLNTLQKPDDPSFFIVCAILFVHVCVRTTVGPDIRYPTSKVGLSGISGKACPIIRPDIQNSARKTISGPTLIPTYIHCGAVA